MYTITTNGKSIQFETKESLIAHFVDRDHAFGIKPETYVPSVFREVAMNHNDSRTVADFHGEFLAGILNPEKTRRTVMVYNDGRVIDIRAWLPEFRAAMEEKTKNAKKVWFGCSGAKPKFQKTYRVVRGIKQRMSLREQIDMEEIAEVAATLPAKMLRQYKPEKDFATRDNCQSWKEQSKCRKSWQRRNSQPSARTMHMADWAMECEEAELLFEEVLQAC